MEENPYESPKDANEPEQRLPFVAYIARTGMFWIVASLCAFVVVRVAYVNFRFLNPTAVDSSPVEVVVTFALALICVSITGWVIFRMPTRDKPPGE